MLSVLTPLIFFQMLLKIFPLDLKTVLVVVLVLLVFLFAVALVINVRFLKKKKMLYGRTHAEEKEHFIQDDKPDIA